ncbi:MAG: DUF86 domain-containing protein [Defluviicoccus sp.]
MRDPREHLTDILEAIAAIARYSVRGREAFLGDELIQVWVFHHLLIIGEAAAQLGREFHARHPDVPWPQIVAMRNVLVHEYFGVDLDRVWQTVEDDLPALKPAVERLLSALEAGQP